MSDTGSPQSYGVYGVDEEEWGEKTETGGDAA